MAEHLLSDLFDSLMFLVDMLFGSPFSRQLRVLFLLSIAVAVTTLLILVTIVFLLVTGHTSVWVAVGLCVAWLIPVLVTLKQFYRLVRLLPESRLRRPDLDTEEGAERYLDELSNAARSQ